MSEKSKRLNISFKGDAFPNGAVPVALLANKLKLLQDILFHAAATVENDTAARRGRWTSRYGEMAELTYVKSHHSELTIEVEVGRSAAVLSPEFDLRGELLDCVFDFGDWVQKGCRAPDTDGPQKMRTDQRESLLRAFNGLLPGEEDNYEIELTNASRSRHPRLLFTPETKKQVRNYFIRETVASDFRPDPMSLVGELIKIHVDVGPQKIAIRRKGRDIDCFYSDAMRDQITNLMAGSMVEVTGDATLDRHGNVIKLDHLLDVSTVSMDSLRISRFEHGGKVYLQREPFVVNVQYEDDLWTYHCPQINLWGCGERREDALKDLHENFAYLWSEIAEESESVLDSQARKIRELLRNNDAHVPAEV
jgi:hypothetical protein